jgi:Ran GTPase-activating protein (RanGAP) involved in mRNA processing and transport
MRYLIFAIALGKLTNLVELSIGENQLDYDLMALFIDAINHGKLPNLEHLSVSSIKEFKLFVNPFMNALKSRKLPKLKLLDIDEIGVEEETENLIKDCQKTVNLIIM